MKLRNTIIAVLAALLLLTGTGYAADPTACTTALYGFRADSPAMNVRFTCTADSDGDFYATTFSDDRIKGMFIVQVDTTPGATNPTAAWDATLKDAGGQDLMGGSILNRSASAKETALPLYTTGVYYQPVVKDSLVLAITGNSVNAAVIVVDVWLWRQ